VASGLRLNVLGPLRLQREGAELDVGGARQREVLARLAVAGGHPVAAESLITDVWGPVAANTAAASLHVSVSKLRRAMEPDRAARSPSPLVSTPGGYALAVVTDASEAERRARRASVLLDGDALGAAYTELTEARSLWRGEPFEDVGEHAWLVPERRRCAELLLYVAGLTAETALRLRQDPAGVVVDLGELVGRYPSHERLAVLLAVALYREQRQDDALHVLRSTRNHLRDLSGLDPGPELQRIEQLILDQLPDPYASTAAPARGPEVASAVSRPVARRAPLVGRGRARAVLDAAAQAAESGQLTTAVLVGEGGIGKTRLARATVDLLRERGWRTVWAHGTEGEGAPALWPWVSVVRALGELAPLTPDLAALVSDAAASAADAEPAAARWRQSQQIQALLEDVAREAPLAVVLDDLQWLDAASRALLVEISASRARCRLLLLITSRSADSSELRSTLAHLARLGAIRLDLGGLTDGDVQALAAAAGLEVNARKLRERTGGNPFLLQETVAIAAEEGTSPLDVVPASVADVLGARMGSLPSDGEHVLLVASVLGSPVDPEAVVRLTGRPPEEVDAALDAALSAGLLREGSDGRIRFRHDLVRETAYARLGAVGRARLHARALETLQAAGRTVPTELAAHARAAGPSHADEAVAWSIAAASEAARRHAPDSALHWWRTALDADHGATQPDSMRRMTVLLGLVRAQLDAGDLVGAIETRAEACRVARHLDNGPLLVDALTSLDGPLVWLPRAMGRVDHAIVHSLERALSDPDETTPAQRAMLLSTLAIEVYAPTEETRCDELTAEALELAEGLGEPRTLAFALNARVAATAFAHRERERAHCADRLVKVAHETGLAGFELAGHQLGARLRLQLFEVRTADAHAHEARRLAKELRLPLPALQQRLWSCSRRALGGDVPAALRLLDTVEEAEWPWWGRDAMLAMVRLMLLLRGQDLAAASPLLEPAAKVHPFLAAAAAAVVSTATGTDPPPMSLTAPPPADWTWLVGGCVRAQAALALGDVDGIRASYDHLQVASGMIASTGSFDAGPVDGYLADLADALGRTDDARHHRALLEELSRREGLLG